VQQRPSIGEANLAALIGAAGGSVGGLFALGIAPAIMFREPYFLARWPVFSLISFVLCGGAGWLIGGQIGPRLGGILGEQRGLIVGGIIGGLIPIAGVAACGWYLVTL
jgi:hypothetical protein